MLIYAGIDEAGYGPMLGPLCIGCSIFKVNDHDPARGAPDLWQRLDRAVCRSRRDRGRRIAVDDSKRLKGQPGTKLHPLHHLERGVLSFLAASRQSRAWLEGLDDDDVFEALGIRTPDHPWYASSTPLPLGEETSLLRITSGRLALALEKAGVTCLGLQCELVDADRFNEQVDLMGNKASVNLCAAMRIIEKIWSGHPEDELHIVADRQGGRTGYRRDLQSAWSDASIRILDEGPALSRYVMNGSKFGRGECTISFSAGGEDMHLPIALASMTAKYCRELLMLRMNRFFLEACPGLEPTAGYVQDARRYLKDIEPVIEDQHIERSLLVRTR